MSSTFDWSRLVALVLSLAIAVGPAYADSELDAATQRAALQEQLKKESDARLAIAKNEADIANVAGSSNAALVKAKADAAKAQQDYYQSIIPDPTKYKVPAPTAPKLAGSATTMSFEETAELSKTVAATVLTASGAGRSKNDAVAKTVVCDGKFISIVRADAGTRTLLALSMSTRATLDTVRRQLADQRTDLQDLISGTPSNKALAIGAVAALGQLAASFATIIKPQYAFDSLSELTTATAVFQAKVYESLSQHPCVQVTEPDAMLTLISLPPVGQPITGSLPEELKLVRDLQDEIQADKGVIKQAGSKAKEKAALSTAKKGDKAAAAALAAEADQLVAAAKALVALDTEAEKSVAALFVADAQGNTPIDAAVRGGVLRDGLSGHDAFSLTLKTISSDVDILSKDCLFCALKVALASNTIVSWQLVDDKGRVRSTGALRKDTPLKRIALP